MSTVARVVAGLIAVVAWLGLAVQFEASFARVGTIAGTLWVMLLYFTVIANLLVAVVFTGVALGVPALSSPRLLGAVTLVILLVGIVYALLLRGLLDLSGGARLADLLNHTVTPILVPLYWLVFAPKGVLRRHDPWLWTLVPIVYFAYALARGLLFGTYAYPFMNVPAIGWARTAAYAIAMALGFQAAGLAMLWLDRKAGIGGHAALGRH